MKQGIEEITRIKNKHEAIGNIVHNHSNIEYGLSMWLTNLISEDEIIGLILTSEMSFRSLIKAFQAIVKYRAKTEKLISDNLEAILNLVKRINTVEQDRNIYAHSLILHYELDYNNKDYKKDDENYVRLKFTGKEKGFKLDMTDIKLQDLKKVIKEQNEVIKEITNYSLKTVGKKKIDTIKLQNM